jgi:hypothetical protein
MRKPHWDPALEFPNLPMKDSTELIQKNETADEHTQRNPEVNVGRDDAKHLAGSTVGWFIQ